MNLRKVCDVVNQESHEVKSTSPTGPWLTPAVRKCGMVALPDHGKTLESWWLPCPSGKGVRRSCGLLARRRSVHYRVNGQGPPHLGGAALLRRPRPRGPVDWRTRGGGQKGPSADDRTARLADTHDFTDGAQALRDLAVLFGRVRAEPRHLRLGGGPCYSRGDRCAREGMG